MILQQLPTFLQLVIGRYSHGHQFTPESHQKNKSFTPEVTRQKPKVTNFIPLVTKQNTMFFTSVVTKDC